MSGNRPWTEAQDLALMRLREDGWSYPEIAGTLDRTRAACMNRLSKLRQPEPIIEAGSDADAAPASPMAPADVVRLIDLLADGTKLTHKGLARIESRLASIEARLSRIEAVWS